MKKVFSKTWLIPLLLIALMSCYSLTSCGDDKEKEEPNPTEETIIGTWKWTGNNEYELLTFEKNGRVTWKEYDAETNRVKNADDGTYSQKNDVITIVMDGEVGIYTILNLTKTILTVRYEGEYVGEYLEWDEGTDISTYIRVE